MKIILNAGHTFSGAGSGAVGYLNESRETRKVVSLLAKKLQAEGHTVKIINVDKAENQSAYLYAVAKRANQEGADLLVSIHFNAGKGRGTECFTWKGKKHKAAVGICDELSKLGFKNRGVKDGSIFYLIRKTEMPAVLVEVCFVDSKADSDLYKSIGENKIARAICNGITKNY